MSNKTDDEIKKGLECCIASSCEPHCPYDNPVDCGYGQSMIEDSFALIKKLEAQNAEQSGKIGQLEKDNHQLRNYIALVQAERDAAVKDMYEAQSIVCLICKNHYQPDPSVKRYSCKVLGEHFGEGSILCGMFEWRGVQKEG